jgi:hypothetical protein
LKKFLKIIFIFFLVVIGILFLVLQALNSESVLNKIASTAIEKSGLDVKYKSLKGGLLDGLDIKGFNYEDKVKADLKFKADFDALKSGVVHVEELNISNLWIDEKFLASLTGDDTNKSSSKERKQNFIKKVIVDHATLNIVDFHYGEYIIDVLTLKIDDLSYDMKKDIKALIYADLNSNVAKAVLTGDIKDQRYNLSLKADPKVAFINKYVKEQNITIENAPHIDLKADGDFHNLKANLRLNRAKLRYNDITVDPQDLNLTALFDIDKGDLDAKVFGFINSSAADLNLISNTKLNINDINNTAMYDFTADILPKSAYLKKLANEQNLTVLKSPTLHLTADGDMKNVNAKIFLDSAKLIYNKIKINPKNLDINASYALKDGDLKADILSLIDSDIANFDLDGKILLNSNDINNSLKIDLLSHLIPQNSLNSLLIDKNISIPKMPQFDLKLKGDYQKLNLLAHLDDGKVLYNKFIIEPKSVDINSSYSLQDGDLKADILADINSNIAHAHVDFKADLNNNDINNTLNFKTLAKIVAPKRKLKDFNLTVTKKTVITLNAKGDSTNIQALLDANGELIYDGIKIRPRIKDTEVLFDLKSQDLKAVLKADIISSIVNVKADTKLSLNVKDINNTLHYDAKLRLNGKKPYKGVNLAPLGVIHADAKGGLKNLEAKVISPKLNLSANSSDFNRFDVDLDTKKIDIGKIYRYLPKELQKSYVNIKSKGFYKLSSNEAKFGTKLRGFKYADKIISTKEFDFYMKGEDIKLSNFSLLADGFKMDLDLEKAGERIKAKIKNQAIDAYADINLEPLNVDANAHINSIDKLLKEIKKVYPLNVGINVDGALDLVASMEGKDAKVALTSEKIKFEDGNIANLNLLAFYNPHRILVKNFDFELKDFEPKEFNRKVRLKRDGLITLDKETNSIDIALENLLEFKGTQKGDVATGKLSAKDLMLAYKDYGSTQLTTQLDMFQSAEQLAVTGFIEFKDTEITYESSFLDVSKDPDIIVITRESKHKKPPPDNFLKNTFLDIEVRAKNEMLYKVDAGEIKFEPDMKIRKDFGTLPKITGKIKVLDGQYDLADKRFQIEEGAIAFRGQEGSNPLLDLHVNYEIEDVVIMISIGGDKNRPKLTFKSKPMMSKKDIFSYLLFGMSASETEGAATSANKAAEKIFGRAVAKDLARELNLDRLDMNRNTLGGIDVKAGKKVNRKSIIYYQNKMSESSVIYERKLSKKWSVETEVGKQGQGVDIFYRKGYK